MTTLIPGAENNINETQEDRRKRLEKMKNELDKTLEEIYAHSKETGQVFPTFDEIERRYFTKLMEICVYNIALAVRVSGMSRSNIYRRIKVYGIPRNGNFKAPAPFVLGGAALKASDKGLPLPDGKVPGSSAVEPSTSTSPVTSEQRDDQIDL